MNMKFYFSILGVFGLICLSLSFDQEYFTKYDNYAVYEVQVDTKNGKTLELVEKMLSTRFDYWKEPHGKNEYSHVMVKGEKKKMFEDILASLSMKHKVLIGDVGTMIRKQLELNNKNTKPWDGAAATFDYGKYHTLDEINNWMTGIETAYPKYVTIFKVATSYQKRDVNVIKISIPNASKKPAVWFDGGIHAREWISSATVIYMAYSLLSNYTTDPVVTSLLNKFDIYVLPVFNVDGYEYTWAGDRLWRKTRSKTPIPTCYGADPNRNWNSHFCAPGASKDPCSDTYCGEKAFSESEVLGVSNFLAKNNDTIVSYMNFHSYSQLWMSPYGYETQKPRDFNFQDQGSIMAVESLTRVYGTKYEHGNIASTIYVASGNSVDWAYDTAKIEWSYAIELRDQGEYGFLLPPEQIIPSGIETYEGLKTLLLYIYNTLEDNN